MGENTNIEKDLSEDERSQIYNQYIGDLYNYGISLNFGHSDCMDAIHDVFVKLFTSKIDISAPNLNFILFRSLKNRLIDIYRKTKKIKYDSTLIQNTDFQFSLNITILDNIVAKEDKDSLEQQIEFLLASLTNKQREAIYLRYFQNLEYEEIGELLNLTPESARKTVYRGIEKLRNKNSLLLFIFFTFTQLR